MLRHHARTIVTMQPSLKAKVRAYFGLPADVALTPAMYQRGLGQADLVLALLRIEHWNARFVIGLLVGKPITIGSPCLLHYRTNGLPTVVPSTDWDARRIASVIPDNPRQPGTDAYLRWHQYQAGRTIGQLRVRGVRRRDIRRALRQGWITLEERA